MSATVEVGRRESAPKSKCDRCKRLVEVVYSAHVFVIHRIDGSVSEGRQMICQGSGKEAR